MNALEKGFESEFAIKRKSKAPKYQPTITDNSKKSNILPEINARTAMLDSYQSLHNDRRSECLKSLNKHQNLNHSEFAVTQKRSKVPKQVDAYKNLNSTEKSRYSYDEHAGDK